MTNDELLAEIARGRAEFEEAAAALGAERRTEPVFDDGWTFKDILAHILTWEKIAMGVVRSGGFSGPSPDEPESGQGVTDAINAKVYADNRDRALDDVVAESDRVYAELREFIAALPDGRLDERLTGEGDPPLVREMLSGNGHEHYREHAAWIRAALAGR